MKTFCLALLGLHFAFWAPPVAPRHPLKMCVCDVKCRPGSGPLNLKFKFFWDDLETVLEKRVGHDLTLTRRSPENDRLLSDFVGANVQLTVNGAPVSLRLTGTEVRDVVLTVEFAGENFQRADTYAVAVTNQILLDVFPDQYNLMRFDFFGDGNLETLRFERAERYLTKMIVRK